MPSPATLTLAFKDEASFAHVTDTVQEDLSAIARVGQSLFLSCDETAGVERLLPDGDHRFGRHEHFNLDEMFDLPDGPNSEMDIEGLAADGGYLWIVGSHSLKRDKPKRKDHRSGEALARMEEIDRDPNRFFLGRVPLEETDPGVFLPVAEVGGRHAQAVRLKKKKSKLLGWLAGDPLLAPFLAIPSKENGFDIEGIAVKGERVWLGLRGPVLRGHAVILELAIKVDDDGHLKARTLEDGRRYRKHLVFGDGLGVRDLQLDGSDLLLLLGPTMSADGPARVMRWRNAVRDTKSGVVDNRRLARIQDLPYRGTVDHPEGLEPWPEAGNDAFLVVYDSPAEERQDKAALTVTGDLFHFADAKRRRR